MPELPEVESARLQLQSALLGRTIERVEVAEDPIVFDRQPPSAVADMLAGRQVTGSGRKGKYFWLVLDEPPYPVFHFGMTGSLRIYRAGEPAPPHCKIELTTADGVAAAIHDPRRFGRIRLAQDPLNEPPISLLGFDPLLDLPSVERLQALLRRRPGPIKGVLLDQKFSAGVGNWIADEVLYQASLSPTRPGNQLDGEEIERLRSCLERVIQTAVGVQAEKARFPAEWLFHRRWPQSREKSIEGRNVVRETIAGRTTAWVPDVQH